MISSVVKDSVPLGKLSPLLPIWYDAPGIENRLRSDGYSVSAKTEVEFSFIRKELANHLKGKYDFDVYAFELTPTGGRKPEEETKLEATHCHLVIGIYGTKTGWNVGDQDPLTPTLREWRAALQTPLKFRLFCLRGSTPPQKLTGQLGTVMRAASDYKTGRVYSEFSTVAELFAQIDSTLQTYSNTAIVRYAIDMAGKEPTSQTEKWLLSPYRTRRTEMLDAFKEVAQTLGAKQGVLSLGGREQPIVMHCVPDSFSIPEARKFAAYVFDDETKERRPRELGRLHFIAIFGGVTDLQIRRHIGNLEEVKVYAAPWGFFASEPGSGVQCVYLPKCTNALRMESAMSQALTWLSGQTQEIGELAALRAKILDLFV
jgi:hypothetical protein